MNDLMKDFHRYFEVLTDGSSAVADAAFRLRYQVYCLETGFEDCGAFADQREHDEFDIHAAHGVIKHRVSNTDVATVRLVLAQTGIGVPGFPIEQQYPELLIQNGVTDQVLPRHLTAEISRFAVSKQMKRRSTDTQKTPAGVSDALLDRLAAEQSADNRRLYPLVTFGLFLALVRMSEKNNITHWLAVMEPPLLRLLARFGIRFIPIGGLIDYHGKRQPCYGRITNVLDGIRETQPDLWRLLTDNGTSAFSTPLAPLEPALVEQAE